MSGLHECDKFFLGSSAVEHLAYRLVIAWQQASIGVGWAVACVNPHAAPSWYAVEQRQHLFQGLICGILSAIVVIFIRANDLRW